MKNLFIAALVTLTLSTTSASFAESSPKISKDQNKSESAASVTLTQTEKSKLDVTVQNAPSSSLTIGLYDSNGSFLASKTVSGSETGTRLRFNLASLEDGVYQVKVKDGKEILVKKFAINTVVPTNSAYQNLTLL